MNVAIKGEKVLVHYRDKFYRPRDALLCYCNSDGTVEWRNNDLTIPLGTLERDGDKAFLRIPIVCAPAPA